MVSLSGVTASVVASLSVVVSLSDVAASVVASVSMWRLFLTWLLLVWPLFLANQTANRSKESNSADSS